LTLDEKIEMTLSGTPAQISEALSALEAVRLRGIQYSLGAYPYPQYLRFQQTAAVKYYYTPISDVYFVISPNSYLTKQTGSAMVVMHYKRPNYFEGSYQAMTLTDIDDVDHSGTIDLVNHFDSGVGHSNTFLIKPGAFTSELQAPLRLEIENTYLTGKPLDFWIGIYHHPTVTDHRFFYGLYSDISGGSAAADPNAIEGYYRTITWTASTYASLFNFAISAADVHCLDGRWYRPIVHLFASHTYTDLYCRLSLVRGSDVLEISEPIYADPDVQYLVFPPVQLPPNKMLRETLPQSIEIEIQGFRTTGSAATLAIDQILLLPLDPSLTLLGFFGVDPSDLLVYDASRDLQNLRSAAAELESVAHVTLGGPLTLYPGEYNRLFLLIANTNHQIDIERTVTLQAMCRERIRFV
jgi:hypothetical protein